MEHPAEGALAGTQHGEKRIDRGLHRMPEVTLELTGDLAVEVDVVLQQFAVALDRSGFLLDDLVDLTAEILDLADATVHPHVLDQREDQQSGGDHRAHGNHCQQPEVVFDESLVHMAAPVIS